jgi:hypothetical protein
MHLSKLKTEALELEKRTYCILHTTKGEYTFQPNTLFIQKNDQLLVLTNSINLFFLLTCNEANRGEYLMGHRMLLSCNGVLRI